MAEEVESVLEDEDEKLEILEDKMCKAQKDLQTCALEDGPEHEDGSHSLSS